LSSRNFRCSLDYAKRAFYHAANAIFGKVAIATSEEVVIQLIKSKCYPVLLYGLEAWVLHKEDRPNRSIDSKRFFMKLCRTINQVIITDCQTFFGIDSSSERLAKFNYQSIRYEI